MRKSRFQPLCVIAATAIAVLCIPNASSVADEQSPPARERSIFVPFSDLHVLLQQQPKRVLLGREEYEDLLKKAKKTPETHAPQAALIVSADYAVTAASQRAEIRGVLAIDVLEDGLHALPLDLGSVGLENATLDKQNASIGRDAAGRLVLFVAGIGRHELTLDMVAPLETTAARQVLNFRLPRPAAAKLRLAVPGDVEVRRRGRRHQPHRRCRGQGDALRPAAPPGRHVDRHDAEQPSPAAESRGGRPQRADRRSHPGLRETLRHRVAGSSLPGRRSIQLRRARGVRDHGGDLSASGPLGRSPARRPQGARREAARADDRDRGAEDCERFARRRSSTVGKPRGWNRWTWSAACRFTDCWSRIV